MKTGLSTIKTEGIRKQEL